MQISKSLNTHTRLGVLWRTTGARGIKAASGDTTRASGETVQASSAAQTLASDQAAASANDSLDPTPYAINNDPERVRFKKVKGMTKLRRWWAFLRKMFAAFMGYVGALRSTEYSNAEKFYMVRNLRRWDPDELDERRRKQSEIDLFKNHKQQAKIIETRIIEKLTALRFCYYITKNEQVHVKRKIKFAHVEVSPYAYVYLAAALPFGVKMTEIAQDWVTNELSATINKKVRIELNQWGLRITVEVASTNSIPNYVEYKDMLDNFPKTAAPLTFALGMGSNGARIYRNLAEAPHMIIAGQTGGGKSNIENGIITSILHRNDPRLIKCVFVDMKGGVEFNFYEGIPHLLEMRATIEGKEWTNPGIIERKHDVIPALKFLLKECEHRLQMLKGANVKNLSEYNRGKRIDKKIPNIVVFFDEWAVISKSEFGKEAMMLVGELGNISRSTGFNLVLCTQYPNAEILNPTISVNFDWRIAFNMTTGASQSVLGGSWDAYGLSPVGRCIFHTSEGNIQVQTPRITNGNIEAIVQGIKTGSIDPAGMLGVDLLEIFEWALNNNGGRLQSETLWNQYREKISKDNLRALLKSADDKTFDVNGTLYKVVNERGGNRVRHLELAEDVGTPA